jgi:hypothetical protein
VSQHEFDLAAVIQAHHAIRIGIDDPQATLRVEAQAMRVAEKTGTETVE